MTRKRLSKSAKHLLGFIVLHFFHVVLYFAPLKFLYILSQLLAKLAYIFASRQREVAKESLGIAFGSSLSPESIKKITISCFEETTRGALEVLTLTDRPEALKQNITLSGVSNLEQALARGKGVVCVSAHFGNFLLLAVRLQLAGFPMCIILRRMRDEKVDNYFLRMRQRLGVEGVYTKPAKTCVDESLAFLKKNGVLFIQMDQNYGSGKGVFVDFFGRKAATATGPVVFALRSKAAIIPAFIIRKPDNTQEIIIEPEFKIEEKATHQETLRHNIACLTKIIESYIRKYPAQWSWIHRRWKSRPSS